MKRDAEDFTCVGISGTWDCNHTPMFIVAGDFACRYHIQSIIQRRIRETRKPAVSVRLVESES